MRTCLRCLTLVDTNVLHELCCSVQGRLKAVLLFLRCVDTVAFGAWVVPSSWCAQDKKKSRSKNKNFVVACVPRRPHGYNSRADVTASYETVPLTAALLLQGDFQTTPSTPSVLYSCSRVVVALAPFAPTLNQVYTPGWRTPKQK